MNYIRAYFNKDSINDLVPDDIITFFSNEKEESDKIEFKSFNNKDIKKDEERLKPIIRSVTGFLNTEGGLLETQ